MTRVCETCPLGDGDGWTDAAEQAINLGCLPSFGEAMHIKRSTGCNWGCHSEERICAGFVRECAVYGLEYRGAPTLSFKEWSDLGLDEAVRLARGRLNQ